ncbi:MAG: HAD family phosphatase [Rhodospirillales bacterium]|nr:HAD family phosphatase [Rhodospirillales bacterium]MCB9996940.1 HAD family phosphatase [Rhodospirillales bacterium]
MKIRACFIDVDGTAVLSEPRNRAAIEDVAAEGGFTITKDHWKKGFAGAGDEVIWERICEEFPEFKNSYADAKSFEDACVDAYAKRISEVEVNRPVLEMVHYLHQNDVYIGVVSNSLESVVRQNLDHTHYPTDEFNVIVCKDEVRKNGMKTKPSADPYKLALDQLNAKLPPGVDPIKPSECLILEDSKTGSRAGLRFGGIVVQLLDDDTALPKKERRTLTDEFNSAYHGCLLDSLHHVCCSVILGTADCIPPIKTAAPGRAP